MKTPGYKVLPLVYDRWQNSYGKDFSAQILPRLLSTIQQFDIPQTTVADVACGTGSLALALRRRRWTVWGVDASEGMIREASAKCAGMEGVLFLQQDMRSFSLPVQVDLVTSLFDSINHLSNRKDLLKTFRSVRRALSDGGYFVFDVNNERCYRTLWMQSETIRHKDFTMILRNSYSPVLRRATSHVTLFLCEGDRRTRMTERVRERCFTNQEIAGALTEAGFSVLLTEDFNFDNDPKMGKLKTWWVACGGGPLSR
jgi:SAM-dependent methyltransferase